MTDPIEQHLETIIHAFVRKPLVMLFEPDARGELIGQGSGTLVRAASGRAALLTASHVVKDVSTMHALASNGAFRDVIANVRAMPGVDVALAELRASAADLNAVAIDAGLLGNPDDPSVTKDDTVVAVGYPEQVTATTFDHARGLAQKWHGDMIYRTVVAGVNRDAISLVWTFGEISEAASIYKEAGFPAAGRINHKMPRGMSGGAVWKQVRGSGLVWTVDEGFRLVGILYEFKNQKQLAVPARLWAEWIHQQLAMM